MLALATCHAVFAVSIQDVKEPKCTVPKLVGLAGLGIIEAPMLGIRLLIIVKACTGGVKT